MPQLNYNTYVQLTEAYNNPNTIIGGNDGDWYNLTYGLFINASLDTIDDLWRIVAYTYSWMPTIPNVRPNLINDPDALLLSLQRLRNGDDAINLQALLEELIPVINNSLVGVSKVLHFIAPTTVPIIDRNVLRGWNAFFVLHPEYNNVPNLPNYNTSLNLNHIQIYLGYRAVLINWVAAIGNAISLRNLEIGFFELGRRT